MRLSGEEIRETLVRMTKDSSSADVKRLCEEQGVQRVKEVLRDLQAERKHTYATMNAATTKRLAEAENEDEELEIEADDAKWRKEYSTYNKGLDIISSAVKRVESKLISVERKGRDAIASCTLDVLKKIDQRLERIEEAITVWVDDNSSD